MKRDLSSEFLKRQHMVSRDFEIYYYKNANFYNVGTHSHTFYEFYFFLEGEATMFYSDFSHRMKTGDMIIIPPGMPHYAEILL